MFPLFDNEIISIFIDCQIHRYENGLSKLFGIHIRLIFIRGFFFSENVLIIHSEKDNIFVFFHFLLLTSHVIPSLLCLPLFHKYICFFFSALFSFLLLRIYSNSTNLLICYLTIFSPLNLCLTITVIFCLSLPFISKSLLAVQVDFAVYAFTTPQIYSKLPGNRPVSTKEAIWR